MTSLLLASTLTIYVGGLVMFVPGKYNGEVDVLMLRGNKLFKHHKTSMGGKLHKAPIGSHEPYLVANAGDVDFDSSSGFRVLGSPGPDQIARFPLSGKVSLANMAFRQGIDVDAELAKSIAAVGSGAKGVCAGQKLHKADFLDQWPVAAQLRLAGVTKVTPFGEPDNLKFTDPTNCPAQNNVYEGVAIELEMGCAPMFTWGTAQKAVLHSKGSANEPVKWYASLWNLPRETTARTTSMMASHHFDAFFSLLEDRSACTCEMEMPISGSQPVFCPPSRGRRP